MGELDTRLPHYSELMPCPAKYSFSRFSEPKSEPSDKFINLGNRKKTKTKTKKKTSCASQTFGKKQKKPKKNKKKTSCASQTFGKKQKKNKKKPKNPPVFR